jgi:hypothetical protein
MLQHNIRQRRRGVMLKHNLRSGSLSTERRGVDDRPKLTRDQKDEILRRYAAGD